MISVIILAIILTLGVVARYLFFSQIQVLTAIEGGIVSLCGALLYQSSYNLSIVETIKEQGPRIIIFALILYLIFWLLRALLPKSVAMVSFSLIIVGLTIGNIIKSYSRNEPLIWNDLRGGTQLIKEVIWDMVLKQHVFLVIIGFILFGTLVVFLLKKNNDYLSWKNRSILLVGSLLVMGFFLSNVNAVLTKAGVIIYPNNNEANIKTNGPGLNFFFSKEGTIIQEPDNYNKQTMQTLITKLQQEYSTKSLDNEKDKPTFIYMLSEAFFDPTLVKGTQWKEDPIPTIRELQKESGGNTLVNVFGGGTANTEYSVLTNMSHELLNPGSVPYAYIKENPDRASSAIPTFKANGYEILALHPYIAESYNRPEVFNALSINKFLSYDELKKQNPQAYYEEGYESDTSFFQSILDNLDNEPQIIHTMTMQNHFPYDVDRKGILKEEDNLLENKDSITGGEQLATYARGIHKTDIAMNGLLENLKKEKKEIYLIFYGDHLPALDKSFYDANTITSNKNQSISKFMTPYFIWNNKGKKVPSEQIINPEFLTLQAHQPSNTLLTPFQQFTYALSQKLPSFDLNTGTYFVNGKEVTEAELDNDTHEMLHDYRLIMYDMLSGKQYAKELFN